MISGDPYGLADSAHMLNGNRFPNPYFDIANTFLPRDIKKTFQWCEYIFFTNGIIRSATMRIAQYFVTEIKYLTEKNKNTDDIKDILEKKVNVKEFLISTGIDVLVYGNSFTAIYLPFKRYLTCGKCGLRMAAEKIDYVFNNFKFNGRCLKCEESVEFKPDDQRDKNPAHINFIRIDPKQIEINYDIYSGKSEYYWMIPQEIIAAIQNTQYVNKLLLNNIPLDILECIEKKQIYKINKEYIFHIKNPTIAGVSPQWGFPSYLTIMKNNYYTAVLKRANEAIALDFVVPFRTISPGQSSPNADPISMFSMKQFVSEMKQMVARHKQDPVDFQIAPFPLNYQAFGAEKKALDLTGEIKLSNEEQLHSLNYPAELFYNSLQVQAMPTALRLFENSWSHLVTGFNGLLQWITDNICSYLNKEQTKVELTKVSIADDIEKRQVLLQLAASQQLSMITALKSYGIDYKEEQKNLAYQNKVLNEIKTDMMADMRNEATMAESPGANLGQMPASSPFDIISQGSQLAQNLLSMPYEMRRSQLLSIKQQNPTLHAVTLQKMKEMRGASRTQMGYQAMAAQGMTGAMTGPGQMPPNGQPGMPISVPMPPR